MAEKARKKEFALLSLILCILQYLIRGKDLKVISKNTIFEVPFSQYKRCRNDDMGVELALSVWITAEGSVSGERIKHLKPIHSPFYHSVQWFEQGFPYITMHLGSAAIHESSATE